MLEEVRARLVCEAVHGSKLLAVTETPDDLLEPEDTTEPADDRDAEDEPSLSGEESLGLLPPD